MLLQIRNNTLVPSARERQNISAETAFTHTHTQSSERMCMYVRLYRSLFQSHGHAQPVSLSLRPTASYFVRFNTFVIMNLCKICCVHQCDNVRLLDYIWQSMCTGPTNNRKNQAAITTDNTYTVDRIWTRFNPIENYIIGKCDYKKKC